MIPNLNLKMRPGIASMRKIENDPELFPLYETVDFKDDIGSFFPALPEDECTNLSSKDDVSSVRRLSDYFPFLEYGRESR